LKSAALDPESTTVVDVVRKLFNLRVENPVAPAPRSAPERIVPSTTSAPEQEHAAIAAPASPSLTNHNQNK
jgi:antitoxin component HigA of HigAB toxin-antitoxin module